MLVRRASVRYRHRRFLRPSMHDKGICLSLLSKEKTREKLLTSCRRRTRRLQRCFAVAASSGRPRRRPGRAGVADVGIVRRQHVHSSDRPEHPTPERLNRSSADGHVPRAAPGGKTNPRTRRLPLRHKQNGVGRIATRRLSRFDRLRALPNDRQKRARRRRHDRRPRWPRFCRQRHPRDVLEFAPGASSIVRTYSKGLSNPVDVAVTDNRLYVTDRGTAADGYAQQIVEFSTTTGQISSVSAVGGLGAGATHNAGVAVNATSPATFFVSANSLSQPPLADRDCTGSTYTFAQNLFPTLWENVALDHNTQVAGVAFDAREPALRCRSLRQRRRRLRVQALQLGLHSHDRRSGEDADVFDGRQRLLGDSQHGKCCQ